MFRGHFLQNIFPVLWIGYRALLNDFDLIHDNKLGCNIHFFLAEHHITLHYLFQELFLPTIDVSFWNQTFWLRKNLSCWKLFFFAPQEYRLSTFSNVGCFFSVRRKRSSRSFWSSAISSCRSSIADALTRHRLRVRSLWSSWTLNFNLSMRWHRSWFNEFFLEIIYIVLTQKRLLTIFWYTKWLLWSLYGTNNCKYKILLWKWKGNKLCNFSACMSSSLKHTSEVEFLKTALWNIFNIDRIHLYNQYWRGEQTTCFWDTTVIIFKEV